MNTYLKPLLTSVSVITGLIAAGLWFAATIVSVPYKRKIVNGQPQMALVETNDETGKEIDIFDTAKRQAKWNRWAALFTAVSVLCQALSLLL